MTDWFQLCFGTVVSGSFATDVDSLMSNERPIMASTSKILYLTSTVHSRQSSKGVAQYLSVPWPWLGHQQGFNFFVLLNSPPMSILIVSSPVGPVSSSKTKASFAECRQERLPHIHDQLMLVTCLSVSATHGQQIERHGESSEVQPNSRDT